MQPVVVVEVTGLDRGCSRTEEEDKLRSKILFFYRGWEELGFAQLVESIPSSFIQIFNYPEYFFAQCWLG